MVEICAADGLLRGSEFNGLDSAHFLRRRTDAVRQVRRIPSGLDEVKLTRMILNDTTGAKQEIILNLEHLDKLNQSSLALYPGDTIFIDHTGWLTLRDVFSFVTTAAVITTAIAQVILVSKR